MLLTIVLPIITISFSLAGRAEPTEMLIRLNVRPMPAPKPALRYLLLPDLKEMTPGNPIQGYLECFFAQDLGAEREVLGVAALRQADRAARMDKPDWQILVKCKTDGISLLLPDVQKIRALASALQTRFRSELAQGHLDEALATARTLFAMARHMGEHPTLIGNLVGIAIATVGIGPLEELLEQPGCPNLYWALTNLPNHLVSLERGFEGERVIMQSVLRELDEKNSMTPAQLKKLIAHLDSLRFQEKQPSVMTWLEARTKDPAFARAARRRLIEYGIPEERLHTFPPEQILLLDERWEFEIRRDEVMKLMNLPTWQVEELFPLIKFNSEAHVFEFLLSSGQKVRRAQGRLEQRLALLRHVEALRLYAADHQGRWPETLTDVNVPLPVDPFTGKPFHYTREGDTAHLRGSPPPGAENIPAHNPHYAITIQK